MSPGLRLFDLLCATGNAIIALREDYCVPASASWVALTSLAQTLDELIDQVVTGLPLEGIEEDEA